MEIKDMEILRIKDKLFIESHRIYIRKQHKRHSSLWKNSGFSMLIPAREYWYYKPTDPVHKKLWEENLPVEIYF